MRPARNQQKRVAAAAARARGRPDEVVLSAGIFGTIRSLTESTGRDRGGPRHRDHGGAPGRRTTCRRARRPGPPGSLARPGGAERPDRSDARPRTEENRHRGEEDPPAGAHAADLRAHDRSPATGWPPSAGPGSRGWGSTSRAAPGSRSSAITSGDNEVTPDQAQAGREHRRPARQRQRCLRGRGLHPGQPQHHRRDPRRERLQPRRRGQAHRAAAVPHRRRPAAARHAGRSQPSESASPLRPRPRPPARPSRARRRPRRPTRRPRTRGRRRSPTPRRAADPTAPAVRAGRARRPQHHSQGGARSTTRSRGRRTPAPSGCSKFAAFTCPPKGAAAAPVADDPSQPLIACDDDGLKFLLSKSLIEGTELKSASYGIPQNGVGWAVNLALQGLGPRGVRRDAPPR